MASTSLPRQPGYRLRRYDRFETLRSKFDFYLCEEGTKMPLHAVGGSLGRNGEGPESIVLREDNMDRTLYASLRTDED